MENYFDRFRKNIIGVDLKYKTPYGIRKMIYADWVASGRMYYPIEKKMIDSIAPYVANTHTGTSETGTMMTKAYHLAHKKIKQHVNAGQNDVIITAGFGMTAVVTKFQRILGLKMRKKSNTEYKISGPDKPVVFITHMEHHSNHTSWFETIADVVVLQPDKELLVNPAELEIQLEKYKDRKIKFGSFTSCSNVTGIETPYYELAKIMHKHGGYCFIDYAASAPYVTINMHPENPEEKLDAVFFSPHKFLGGPGSSGVIVFDSALYTYDSPDQPGGGTVLWTNPWGEYHYYDDIEIREDGGTPGFLQAIRTALCIELKNQMGVENIRKREEELVKIAFRELRKIPKLHILADNTENRLGIMSFYVEGIHYNLIVKLLSDRYGIQVRGGCACAGTYGHYLLNVSYYKSHKITDKIDSGDLSEKPGWVRLSLHPTMTDEELLFIIDSVKQIADNFKEWKNDYLYDKHSNEYRYINETNERDRIVQEWFEI